jgi:diacylglycerol kinase family enzyme
MRVTLVHNPRAGDQRQSPKRILKALAEAGYEAEVATRGRKGLQKAMKSPGDLVVVAGGDGSIHKVAVALAGRKIPIAILPIGTANNIAKSLGVTGAIQDLIARWHYDQRRKLALGSVTAPFGTERFVESVGVGAFTELVARGAEEVDENTAGLTGHEIDRALLLFQRIVAEREPLPRRLEIDGMDASGEYLLVEAMNTRMVGPNVPLAPEADSSDDRLDVVTATNAERKVLTEYLEARLAGGAAPPALTVRRGKEVKMYASPRELHVAEVTIAIGAIWVDVLAPG